MKRIKVLTPILIALLLLLIACSQTEENTDPTTTDTTQPTEIANNESTDITLQFTGDVFLHRRPIDVARTGDNTYDFNPFLQHIAPHLTGDLTIANMETPVDVLGNNQDITSFPLFNAPFEILEALRNAGFDHLISANNHSFDRGFDGLVATVNNFERAGINHTGMNVDREDFDTPTILDIEGIQVGIIAYTDSVNGEEWRVPPEMLPYAVRRFRSDNLDSIPTITQDIADLRTSGAEVVIVALHWGAEYVDEPTEMQRQIATEIAEAGADVIMGKHSHTVQPVEWHEREDGSRTLIMYSLGNFLADQTGLTDSTLGAHDSGVAEQINPNASNLSNIAFPGRTQFGMLVSLQVSRDADGNITLNEANVLPTLCMRDYSGNTLGTVNGVSVMPLVDGELPDFVTDADLRGWGQVAYNHLVNVVGEEWIGNFQTD